MSDGIFFLLALVVGAIVMGGAWYLAHKRREAFRHFAKAHQLSYSREDPFGMDAVPFSLFRKGDGRKVENVLWGHWRGEPMRAFDYHYYEESSDPDGGTSRTYHRYTTVLLEVPEAAFPHLSGYRENLLTRAADGLGFRDLDFESEDFNKAFQVKSTEPKFAYAFLDARMITYLLGLPGKPEFEVLGKYLLVFVKKRVKPVEFAPIIEMALAFRKKVPRAALSLYGRDTETMRGREQRT